MSGPAVVALGGGHGLSASLSALKLVSDDITAVVTVADNGGSSGRLREEFDVLPPGERPGTPPTAFRVLGGAGLMIEAGVWHHGPVPVSEVGLLEILETSGAADRIDRRPLLDLIGFEAARISLPEEVPPPSGST